MRLEASFRLLFVLYCLEAGFFLVTTPWMPAWDRAMVQMPWALLRNAMLSAWMRGAWTGFGFVHLLWGIHDLVGWVTRRPPEPHGR